MTELILGFPFQDGMVLQREKQNELWGRDVPRQRIIVTVETKDELFTVEAQADEGGEFSATLPVIPDGGPHRLRVDGSTTRVVSDVLCGEVWLASGQSNMEWPVSASQNAEAEIEAAGDPWLRVLKVQKRASAEACREAEGNWERASPDTVGAFSAVGYSFARELRRRFEVPVGIIDATWGGTSIVAWTSLAGQRELNPRVDEELEALKHTRGLAKLREEYQCQLTAWERESLPADPPNTGEKKGYARPEFNDSEWQTIRLPAFFQHCGMVFNGVVWFRCAVDVPPGWAGKDLSLRLGPIDDFDHTYFNGELVGSHPKGTPEAFQIPRNYVVPSRLVRPGKNVIAVRVFDHFGEGGFAGPKRGMRLGLLDEPGSFLPLDIDWRARAEHPIPLVSQAVWETFPVPPRALTPEHWPAALHHGMVSPVAPYGIRGVIWYQGEQDVEEHACYAERQVALRRDLAAHFRAESLPLLLVELAGYRGGAHWPHLREAQQKATSDPNIHLATARDIGEPDDIHPRNKHEVARRLSLVARRRVYGDSVEDAGPRFERWEVDGSQARVWFKSETPLRARGGASLGGFELADDSGVFHPAEASIARNHVILHAAPVKQPSFVRYAFSDTGEGDLENDAGLPALSFRADRRPSQEHSEI